MNSLSEQLAAALPQSAGPAPEWLRLMRDHNAGQFRRYGLPSRKDEAWKYTGLAALEQEGMHLASAAGGEDARQVAPTALVDADYQVCMLDGHTLEQSGNMAQGLSVYTLASALEKGIIGLQALLESLPDEKGSSNGFTTLNNATLESGLVVHIAAGTDAGRLLINWTTLEGDLPKLVNTRLCVMLEKGAKLELVEQFEDQNNNGCNIVMQAELAEASRLQHIRFQQASESAALVSRTEISQQAESDYAYFGFDLGGGLVRHDVHATLKGEKARAGINGAYLLDGKRHVDNHARVDHVAPGGFSEQYFRGVAGGSSRAVFNTAVCVHPGADETEAMQSNANILLSARAEVDTKPELEIYADEVVASHGATVGQLDEQAVFYLRSRGLSDFEARQMLTTAFCRSVSDKLADPALGELISQRMMSVMPEAG
jgi:Fe-S cluster assembly protein SufD